MAGFSRESTLLSICAYGDQIPHIDPRGLFSVSSVNCVKNTQKSLGCFLAWTEYNFQHVNKPSRQILTQNIAMAERLIADFLGYPVGPTYIEGESHYVGVWGETVRLDYNKVLTTGTQTITKAATSTLREFSDVGNWGYNNTVTYTFDGVYDCNFFITPESKDGDIAYRIDPIEVEIVGNTTKISMPVYVAVDPDNYNNFARQEDKDLDMCNEDTYPETMTLHTRSFAIPSGRAIVDHPYCTCGHQDNCDGCHEHNLDVCLLPQNPENGDFIIIPIMNTAEEGQPECWERLYGGSEYDVWFDYYHCDKQLWKPLSIKVNYLAGCGACWGDTCFPFNACPNLRRAIMYLATAFMDTCDCDCLSDFFTYYRKDLRITAPKRERAILFPSDDINIFHFGSRQGMVDAYKLLEHLRDKRTEYAIIV